MCGNGNTVGNIGCQERASDLISHSQFRCAETHAEAALGAIYDPYCDSLGMCVQSRVFMPTEPPCKSSDRRDERLAAVGREGCGTRAIGKRNCAKDQA